MAQQVEEAVAGGSAPAAVVDQKTTRTVVRPATAGSSKMLASRAATTPVARLEQAPVPLSSRSKKTASMLGKSSVTCTTETILPETAKGVHERLASLGYTPLIWYTENRRTSGGYIRAVLARSSLGQSVLITLPNERITNDNRFNESVVSVSRADESPVPAETNDYFAKELFDKPLGEKVDTDLATFSSEGFSIWMRDGSEPSHWLYDDQVKAAELSGIVDGTMKYPSTSLEQLREPPRENSRLIPDILTASPPGGVSFNVLAGLLKTTGLDAPLRTDTWTLLAPTDDAFAAMDAATLNELQRPESMEKLKAILEYHVYKGRLDSAVIGDQPTLQGESVLFDKTTEDVTANGEDVLGVNWESANGVIHILGGVLMPRSFTDVVPDLKPGVDFNDIDYTTQKTRQVDAQQAAVEVNALVKSKTRLDENLDALADVRQKTFTVLANDTLAKTNTYTRLAAEPSRKQEALVLNTTIAKENETLEGLEKDQQSEFNAIRMEVDALNKRIEDLLGKFRQDVANVAGAV